jgi:uncharacterized protein
MTGGWVRRHPVKGFFAIAFGLSWGPILMIMASRGFDLSPLQAVEGGLIFLAMLVGPSVAGILCTTRLEGRSGLHQLWERLRHWQVAVAWYLVAILTVPAILLLVLTGLSLLVDPAFAPRFQWPLFALGLLAGLFEEIGWTGFATPRLLAAKPALGAGLTLGLIWATWHLLVDFRYNAGAMGSVWLLGFAVTYLATLTPYRMLMTWVYSHTQSLLLAIVMHASFTGSLLVLVPIVPVSLGFYWQTAFAMVLWGLVSLVAWRNWRAVARHPNPRTDPLTSQGDLQK